MSSVLLEARSFRPFKSSEEYLYAMKEDLAEWFQTMYPHLNIAVDNFMERLETGVALCEHANAVKAQAQEYVEKKQAKKVMTRSATGSLAIAQTLMQIVDVKYFNTAKAGTFFARDNVSNFINWCRNSLKIIECLLFESDDLIMRKNEKHVILCLLEVARRGARFGMLAPMLVQMERQIDREIAADQKKLGVLCNENHNGLDDDSDSDMEDEETVLMYGPVPQIITNDLKSLDEMVRDLVEKCTCPTQFPMIRVSEGKYRIGDTKVLIFVRILRNHVMVRVGGGWDTLSHYLDKHDPCRCKSQHRTTQSARLVNKPGAADLHGSHVYYDRVPAIPVVDASPPLQNGHHGTHSLGPPMNSLNRSRSRSPSYHSYVDVRRSVSPNFPRKSLVPPPSRSRSPTPNLATPAKGPAGANRSPQHRGSYSSSGPQSLPIISTSPKSKVDSSKGSKPDANLHDTDHSDTTSEMSDEGYRSLGIVQDKYRQRSSLYSQNSTEDADENEHHQVYTEEELNDFGLRKTKFSERIYENDIRLKLERNLQSIERLTESPIHSPEGTKDIKEFKEYSKPKEKPEIPSTDGRQKERSFVNQKQIMRANSAERKLEAQKSPKRGAQKQESKISTWNGRTKSARPSISFDTYVSPFTRNSTGRRSVSAVSYDRRSSSANTSPTKSKLKQELLQAVKRADDDETIALQVQELLKKYGSLSTLNDMQNNHQPQPQPFTRGGERMSYRSPRKDSRPDNNLSRIPAPIAFSNT